MKLPWVLERIAHGGVFIALGLILGITFGVMYLRFYKVVHEPVPMYEQAILWVEVVLLMWSYLRAVYTVPEKFKFTPTEHEIYSMHYKDSRIDIEGMLQEPNSEEDALHLLGLGPQELKVKPFNVLQFCTVCKSYKRPRSHHCSKCGYCVNKMDHHCPWINTCVNERNHKAFCLFLFYVSVACSHGVVLTVPFFTSIIWRRKKLNWIHTICGLWCGCASFSLVVAMLMLLWEQKRGVLENATQVEEYIRYKAWDRRDFINRKNTAEQNRAKKQLKNNEPVTGWRTQLPMPDFIYPYDLGKFNNFVQVFGPTSRWWMWFLPIKPDWTDVDENNAHIDNITYWEVLPGCGQFSLTIEQLSQKAEKLRALKTVQATEEFSGAFSSWFCCWARLACRMGFKATTWHIPSVLDSRVDVKPGNTFNVTRTSNPHWYYGSKVLANSNKKGPSGWFPRLNCKNVEGEPFGHERLTNLEGVWKLKSGALLHFDPLRVRMEGSNEAYTFKERDLTNSGDKNKAENAQNGKEEEDSVLVLLNVLLESITPTTLTWKTGQTWERVPLSEVFSKNGECAEHQEDEDGDEESLELLAKKKNN